MAACRSCGTVIDWATLPDSKAIPLDRTSAGNPSGNIAVRRTPSGTLAARVIAARDQPEDGEVRGISHFATCPHAAQHRKRDKS